MPLIRPRPRGITEQHGRRPVFTGRGPEAASTIQEPAALVGRFERSSWTLARRSIVFGGVTVAAGS
jgi:hypothetical protein